MSRRKKSHQSHGTANRPRLWGKHAVAAALDNPERKVLRAWATRDTAAFMQFPRDVAVTLAEAPDLGRLVPNDAPHQGVVIEVDPLEEVWLDGILTDAPERAVLLVLDQVTDPHNVGAILRSAAAFCAIGIVPQDRPSPPESGALAKAASGALERVPWVRVVNLARSLEEIGEAGFWRIGLAGEADTDLTDAFGSPRVRLGLGPGRALRSECRLMVRTTDTLHESLDELAKLEPAFAAVLERHGRPEPRVSPPGATSLLRTIVGQQVSVAAARSMWAKLEAAFGSPPDLEKLLVATDEDMRAAGMSRQKAGYIRSLAGLVTSGELDLNNLPDDDEEAIALLTKIKGIGRWSAEIYLLFAEGRADVFPAGDLAVMVELGRLMGLPDKPRREQ